MNINGYEVKRYIVKEPIDSEWSSCVRWHVLNEFEKYRYDVPPCI